MLNPFPELLDFAIFAPVFVRVIVGVFFLKFGWNKLTKDREHKLNFFESIGLRPAGVYLTILGFAEILIGIALVLGAGTQIAAIIVAIITLISWIIKIRHPEYLVSPANTYLVLFLLSLSLLLSGAGLPAIDLPF